MKLYAEGKRIYLRGRGRKTKRNVVFPHNHSYMARDIGHWTIFGYKKNGVLWFSSVDPHYIKYRYKYFPRKEKQFRYQKEKWTYDESTWMI